MASILADRQYTLSEYKHYEQLNISNELDQDVIEKINRIAKRVGAPSYQKTPVFKRNHYHKKNVKKENITSADWQTIRNFKNIDIKFYQIKVSKWLWKNTTIYTNYMNQISYDHSLIKHVNGWNGCKLI